jgi:hypothetical protein
MPNQPITIPPYSMDHSDKEIQSFYQSIALGLTPLEKLTAAAAAFLEQPYFFEPLGEGKEGQYDQSPLYRTDIFDCVTYLDTVLALFNSTNLLTYQQNMMQIRYKNSIQQYQQRTDWFTDLEWLPNVRQIGWVHDITSEMIPFTHQSFIAKTIIDKPRWYEVKAMRALRLLKIPDAEQLEALLMNLRNEGRAFQAEPSEITYIPSDQLIDADGNPDAPLFRQIPSGTVVVFVRADWQIRDKFKDYPNGYGTNLNVCHVGLLLWIDDTLMLFNACGTDKKVLSIPLADYLKRHLTINRIDGIHLEKIIL